MKENRVQNRSGRWVQTERNVGDTEGGVNTWVLGSDFFDGRNCF